MAKASSQVKSFSERTSALSQFRNLKMAGSAHAYVRGNTLKFYEWLAASEAYAVVPGSSTSGVQWVGEAETDRRTGLIGSCRIPSAVLRRRGSRRTVAAPLRGLSRSMMSQ